MQSAQKSSHVMKSQIPILQYFSKSSPKETIDQPKYIHQNKCHAKEWEEEI